MDPVSGKERQLHFFTGQPKEEGAVLNVLALSRALPDPRGGLGEAGSEPSLVALTRSIKLSARRCAEREATTSPGGAGAGGGGAAS